MNNSTHFLLIFYTVFLFVSCNSSQETPIENQRPNIVLILTDDQGWGDLSLNGNSVIKTPNIDSLAKNGAIFDRFYVHAVCSPTRASMLTGRYAVRGGVYSTSAGGERLDLDEGTFAEAFQQAGYKTGAFGKWHNGMQYPYHPNARGFEEFYGYCSGHWGNYVDAMLENNGQLVQSEGFLTDVLTDKAIEYIEENKDEPFLVYLPLNTPHSPMSVTDAWWDKYKNEQLPEHRYSEREKIEHSRAAYAMCENIDWNVGRLSRKLVDLGLDDNTIILYLSDNGPNGWRWNGGMEGTKGSTNEGGVRSPLMIHWPAKIKPGKIVERIAGDIDIFPTLAELAEIEFTPKNPLDGKSLKPLLLEDQPQWEDRTIINHWRDKTSVRSQEFRLDHENQLFHMISDPGQTKDVTDQYPEIAEKLLTTKSNWMVEILPELPVEDTRSFPVGHPDYLFTQMPARDAIAHGNIQRSNRWPNCSFYTNWTDVNDSISWDVEVLAGGIYEATVYYTCKKEDVGTAIQLSFGNETVSTIVEEAHDPPLKGMEYDRFERGESYVKDFKPLKLGAIRLTSGTGSMALKALAIPGESAIDFRLMMLERVGE